MRMTVVGVALLTAAAFVVALGMVPASALVHEGERVWPVMLFVAAITVVAELASRAGVFDVAAGVVARAARGRSWGLWALVVLLATASTVFLSLDTTAVLITPVVVILARRVGLNPVPFALTAVWLANTGSLLLPVSNLTNLLAHRAAGGGSVGAFVALTWLPALVCVIVPVAVIAVVYRRELSSAIPLSAGGTAAETGGRDRLLCALACTIVVLLLPLLVSAVLVWWTACAAALLLIGVFAWRRPTTLRLRLVPGPLLLLVAGLFAAVAIAHAWGLGEFVDAVVGDGEDALGLLRVSASGAVAANLADNLPAYLALKPAAGSPARSIALLIGVNAGALITPWASLATLLWHARLVSLGVRMPWRRFALLGLVVAPLTVVAGTCALVVIVHAAA